MVLTRYSFGYASLARYTSQTVNYINIQLYSCPFTCTIQFSEHDGLQYHQQYPWRTDSCQYCQWQHELDVSSFNMHRLEFSSILPVSVGIVIVAAVSLVISFMGYTVLHW
jgi:hypothetical protein